MDGVITWQQVGGIAVAISVVLGIVITGGKHFFYPAQKGAALETKIEVMKTNIEWIRNTMENGHADCPFRKGTQ